jgi:hypothetical protein
MLYKFDKSKVQIQRVRVKSLNSVSGAINIIDESNTHKEKTKKLECSNVIARTFRTIYGVTNFQVPHECCIMMYDGTVIALEKAIINERTYTGIDGSIKEWTPSMLSTFEKVLNLIDNDDDWYIDGTYVYTFGTTVRDAIENGDALHSEMNFKSVGCTAIMLNYIGYNDVVATESRNCLAYVANNGEYAISPPIWKSYGFVGGLGVTEDGVADNLETADAKRLVNLQFAIIAGINVTRIYGYDSIEALQLPKLMIQLKTVNLQSLPQEVKETFDMGMTYTHALAWTLGLMKRVPSFEDMMYMKRLLKYLTSTGSSSRVSVDVLMEPVRVPLMTMDQAYDNAATKKTGTFN